MGSQKYWKLLIPLSFCLAATPGRATQGPGSEFEADILVLFPPLTSPEPAARITRAIEEQTGISAGYVIAESDQPAPKAEPLEECRETLARAHGAYKEMHLLKARSLAREAEQRCIKKMPFESCRELIFQAQLLIGMVEQALDNKEAAGEAFQSAHQANPSTVLDPRKYPPRTTRAFSGACIEMSEQQKTDLKLQSNPEGATFQINGTDLQGNAHVQLPPGRHIVSAKLLGYRHRNQIVVIPNDNAVGSTAIVELSPLSDQQAFDELKRVLYHRPFDPGRSGLPQLLTRFNIDYFLTLQTTDDATGFRVAWGKTGSPTIRELPPLQNLDLPWEDTFGRALLDVLGLARPTVEEESTMAPQTNTQDLPIEDELEEDDESFVVRLQTSEAPKKEKSELRKILTSPWFWGSVGAVICIAGGVILATQID